MVRNTIKKSGFTLIEILVVISIIAILSTIGLILYQKVHSKTRDSIRKRDLSNLATALEIYAQQHNGLYISSVTSCQTNPDNTFYNLIKNHMSDQKVPTDPLNKDQAYCYLSTNGSTYTLCAHLENTSDPDYVANPTGCGSSYHYVLTPR